MNSSRKPLADDALFKTLRGLHPSEAMLKDISIVERQTLERLREAEKSGSKRAGRRTGFTIRKRNEPRSAKF